MIPVLILFGLVFGRWWRSALAVGTVGWPVVLVVDGAMEVELGLLGAAGLALVNTAVGVLVHQAILFAVRKARAGRSANAGDGARTNDAGTNDARNAG